MRIKMSFHRIHLYRPRPSGQKVTISMRGGKIKANVDELTAPTREMIPPKFGIMQAKRTKEQKRKNGN